MGVGVYCLSIDTGENRRNGRVQAGLQREVVYLGWPIAPSYMSPIAGERGGVAGSQPKWTAVHRSPNKLWRSNFIFNEWEGGILNLPATIEPLSPLNTTESSDSSEARVTFTIFQCIDVVVHKRFYRNEEDQNVSRWKSITWFGVMD